MVLDDAVFSEGFRPEEIRFAKYTTEQSSYEAEEDEDKVVDRLVIDTVIGFEQSQLSGTGWIQGFENDRCPKRAEKSSPEDFSREISADFLVDLVSFA